MRHIARVWLPLCVAIVAGACSIHHRSDAYACTESSECTGGRTCVDGFCSYLPDAKGPKSGCTDGVDNDGDGLADGADPGCTSDGDDSEHGSAACDDGVDNDNDGTTDYA